MTENRRTSEEKLYEAESGKRINDQVKVIPSCPLPADHVMTDTEALLDICHEKDPASLKRGTLGTFNGVFIFQFMSTWGILIFLRLGYIVGNAGLVLTIGLFSLGYIVGFCTTLSQAILATNDRNMQGGGVYFFISRVFGPGLGGGFGIFYYFGDILCGTLSTLGLVEFTLENYGAVKGHTANLLPEGYSYQVLYGFIAIFVCAIICLIGTGFFSKLFYPIALATLMGTVNFYASLAFNAPFEKEDLLFNGPNWKTLQANMWPQWLPDSSIYVQFSTLLSLVYPACTGVLGGSCMSGHLKNPGKSIPRGSVYSTVITFLCYILGILLIASSVDRNSLINNLNFAFEISIAPIVIQICMFSMCFFAILGTIISQAELLQALAMDNILPILSLVSSGNSHKPSRAIILTGVLMMATTLLNSLDAVVPLLSIICLIAYGLVNGTSLSLALSKVPYVRPTFRLKRKYQIAVAAMGIISCMIVALILSPFLTLISPLLIGPLILLVQNYGPDKYVWGPIDIAFTELSVARAMAKLSDFKSLKLCDRVTSKLWRPTILFLTDDITKNSDLFNFFDWMFRESLGVTMAVTFNSASKLYLNHIAVKVLDKDEDKTKSLCSVIKYHGFGDYSCNTVIVSPDLGNHINWSKLFNVSVMEEGKNLIVPINLERLNKNGQYIDVWMLGHSQNMKMVQSKRGSTPVPPIPCRLTKSPSISESIKRASIGAGGSNLTPTPYQERIFDFSLNNPMLSMSEAVYDYALILQLSEMIRAKVHDSCVRIFVIVSEAKDEIKIEIENLFTSMLLPIPKVIQIELKLNSRSRGLSETQRPVIDRQWLKWNLIDPYTSDDTILAISTLNVETRNEYTNLSVPILLVKGSHSTLA